MKINSNSFYPIGRFRKAFILVLFILGTFTVETMAQGGPSPTGLPPGGGCVPPNCVPIDGGLSLLIAAGAAFGGKKIYDQFRD